MQIVNRNPTIIIKLVVLKKRRQKTIKISSYRYVKDFMLTQKPVTRLMFLFGTRDFTTFNVKKRCWKKGTYWNSVYSRILSPSIRILIPTKKIDQNVLERKEKADTAMYNILRYCHISKMMGCHSFCFLFGVFRGGGA